MRQLYTADAPGIVQYTAGMFQAIYPASPRGRVSGAGRGAAIEVLFDDTNKDIPSRVESKDLEKDYNPPPHQRFQLSSVTLPGPQQQQFRLVKH
jgi:hypothetical protein